VFTLALEVRRRFFEDFEDDFDLEDDLEDLQTCLFLRELDFFFRFGLLCLDATLRLERVFL
jgi:hypothetical protein